jgi:transcriptional regulator with XRE-family HTH domain
MTKTKNREPTADAVEILHRRYFEGKPEMLALLEEERIKASVAQQVYDLREAAGLTQAELAQRVGTTASVICRLEDADYAGHSLTMLRRIAAALDHRVEVRFVPAKLAPPDAIEEMPRKRHVGRKRKRADPAGAAARPKAGGGVEHAGSRK